MSKYADQERRLSEPVLYLHDATLNTVNLDWPRGIVRLAFTVDVDVLRIIEATGVTELKCPRLLPWGPSNSVNSSVVKTVADGQCLTIEMQSGDVLEVCCREVAYEPARE